MPHTLAGATAGLDPGGKLGLDPEDLRLRVLAGLAITAFSLSGRRWVYSGGHGDRKAPREGMARAIQAVPASLDLSAPTQPPAQVRPQPRARVRAPAGLYGRRSGRGFYV